jgi:hypothetical protein
MAGRPEDDPGWPFLRQSDHILLEVSSVSYLVIIISLLFQEQTGRKFDNKTHTWIADARDGFAIVEIKIVEGNLLTVQTPDGQMVWIGRIRYGLR